MSIEEDRVPELVPAAVPSDSLPVLGRSPRFANAYFAFGHGHVGLTAAAPTGELIADLVTGTMPALDVRPYAAERFGMHGRTPNAGGDKNSLPG